MKMYAALLMISPEDDLKAANTTHPRYLRIKKLKFPVV